MVCIWNWCKPLLARMPEVRNAITMPIGHGSFDLKGGIELVNLCVIKDMAIVLPNSLKSAFIPACGKIPLRRG